MSAFQVSSRHIAALADAAFAVQMTMPYTRDELCKLLAEENSKSLASLYHASDVKPFAVFDFAPYNRNVIRDFTPLVLLKAIACYEYQSCEHGGWYTSDAHDICQRLRKELVKQLAGWDHADGWGIE